MPDLNMPAPRVQPIDLRTGLMAREWFLFFSRIGTASADGDKGDVTVSTDGTTITINIGAVATAKLGGDITTLAKLLLTKATTLDMRAVLEVDAANTPYDPHDASVWGGAEPVDVAEALDRLAVITDGDFVSLSGDKMYGDLTVATSGANSQVLVDAELGYDPVFGLRYDDVLRGRMYFSNLYSRLHLSVFDAAGGDENVGVTLEHNAGVVLKYLNSTRLETHEYGTEVTGVNTQHAQTTTANNGDSTQIEDYVDQVVCTHLTSRATHEFVFPVNPVNRQKLGICGGMADITTVTLTPSSTETILGLITTLPAYGSARWEYFSNDTSWHRIDCNIGGESGLSHAQVLARGLGA